MASIIVISGTNQGDYYPLGRRTNVIGRAKSLAIHILDEQISRKHLQISFDADKNQYYALDMNSRHGIFINDKKITDQTILVDEDQIRIGQTTILFTDEDFTDRDSALSHFKKVGERIRPTAIE